MANQSISQRPEATTLKDNDLIPISQKQPNGSYLTCKVTADKLKGASSYQQWFNQNTSENTYLTMQSIQQIQQVSNYNSISSFIAATNLNSTYNNWAQNNLEVQLGYLTDSDLLEQFNTFLQADSSRTFNDFLVNQNLSASFNSWLTANQSDLFASFAQNTEALAAYTSYLQTHAQATIQQFLSNIGAQDGFNNWLEARVDKLTEDAFNRMMEGKTSKPVPASKFEKFWISLCGIYQPSSPPAPSDLLVNAIALPTDIFFDRNEKHQVSPIDENIPNFMLTSSTGFWIRDAGHYTEDGIHTEEPIELTVTPNGDFAPFNWLDAGQRLYVKAGSTLEVGWADTPAAMALKTVTLVAKKKVEVESDTAVVKLSGWFKIYDSVKGWVLMSTASGALPAILSLGDVAFFSDKFLFQDSMLSNFFYNDFSAVATDYDPIFYQHGTVTIKNMSGIDRVLTLVPYNQGTTYISSVDENPNDLPSNIQINGGVIAINLTANQDA
ncbi:hypothetical protein [Alkanindiges illinoisensis]|uniref:hypothetical protein n=1 Tax=Alkanindiges illinoisensis TaxID=197183 RepID=UPI00047E6537|nr:hypothetical protein [Alkanindiges illinoisensis]